MRKERKNDPKKEKSQKDAFKKLNWISSRREGFVTCTFRISPPPLSLPASGGHLKSGRYRLQDLLLYIVEP